MTNTRSTKRTSKKTVYTTTSKLYNRLAETENVFHVRTTPDTQAGVKIQSKGAKKRSTVELLLPSTTLDGAKRMVKVQLTGRQAKALFDTLHRHYGA